MSLSSQNAENSPPNNHAILAILVLSAIAITALFWLIYVYTPTVQNPEKFAILAPINASLNALSLIAILAGLSFIRQKKQQHHQKAMLIAFAFSSAFLISYIIYHSTHGDSTFTGTGYIRPIYFSILISHIVLTVVALPMILLTFFLGLRKKVTSHKKLARWTAPIWVYISLTGVLIYVIRQSAIS